MVLHNSIEGRMGCETRMKQYSTVAQDLLVSGNPSILATDRTCTQTVFNSVELANMIQHSSGWWGIELELDTLQRFVKAASTV